MKSFIVLLLGTVCGSSNEYPEPVVVVNGVQVGQGSTGAFSASIISSGMRSDGVTGAPYSALEVNENVQTLADGTHITQPSAKTMYYRDSRGRTRTEHTFPLPPGVVAGADSGPNTIEIRDPVAGVQYSLDTRNHQARKNSTASQTWGIPATYGVASTPPPPTGSAGKPLAANRTTTFVPVPNDERQRPEISTESLGTQLIEGVSAEGSRTTTVYPVNFFGNDRPITTVSETWTSPDLKLTVLSKNSDRCALPLARAARTPVTVRSRRTFL